MTKKILSEREIINENKENIENSLRNTIKEVFFYKSKSIIENITVEYSSENKLIINGITNDSNKEILKEIEFHKSAANDGRIDSHLELAWLYLLANNRDSAFIWFDKVAAEYEGLENEIDFKLPSIQTQIAIILIYCEEVTEGILKIFLKNLSEDCIGVDFYRHILEILAYLYHVSKKIKTTIGYELAKERYERYEKLIISIS